MNDVGVLFQSYNASAGNAAQFNITHAYGAVTISNVRGALTLNGNISGSAGSAGYASDYANYLIAADTRTISPSSHASARLRFGFTSYANNNTAPWADFLHLRTYTDGSGGNENLVTFRKDIIGGRIWQQAWGSGTAYADYRDIALLAISDSAPANAGSGHMWWQSSTGKLKIYYYDGTSSQWVDAVPIPDTSTLYSKAGGAITGPVSMSSSLSVTGVLSLSNILTQTTGNYIYPGSASGLSNNQTSYYLASHNGWGIYTNTSFNAAGGVYDVGNRVLSTATFNSYSPTLTGGSASGTWGINVTGSSASCTGNSATSSSEL
jgi:hypothetical protein